MAGIRDIRRHIQSVENLRHLTSAMTRVATARGRKHRRHLGLLKPYVSGLERVMSLMTLRHGLQHPLLQPRAIVKDVVIVIGSDRGLCGSYNNEILKSFSNLEYPEPSISRTIIVFGTKLASIMKKAGQTISRVESLPRFALAEEIAPHTQELAKGYLQNRFQRVIILRSSDPEGTTSRGVGSRILFPASPPQQQSLARLSPEIEPSSLDLFDHLVPRYLLSELRVAFLEAMIVEEETRALAMQSATTNAEELRDELSMRYRRLRQERITRELLELVAASQGIVR